MNVHAYISKPNSPTLDSVPVVFPIPSGDYDTIIGQLNEMGIGSPLLHDCCLTNIDGGPKILQELNLNPVNLDEFDYLIKRLDSFTEDEISQFQATAHHLKLKDVKDLINLTFCCSQVTVISDFSNLERAGKRHYLTLQGGTAPTAEYNDVDGEKTARRLISDGTPIVTPYGVLYENGMKLEPVYEGTAFPLYQYDNSPLILELDSHAGLTYLYLPMPEQQLNHILQRSQITDDSPCYRIVENELPACVHFIAETGWNAVHDLNHLCRAISTLDKGELNKLGAAIFIANPEHTNEVVELVKNLELFDLIPDVRDAEEYGRYMIQESGRFDYDENPEDFYDYEGYGKHRIEQEQGIFTCYGYVNYSGTLSLEELIRGDPTDQAMQMNSL